MTGPERTAHDDAVPSVRRRAEQRPGTEEAGDLTGEAVIRRANGDLHVTDHLGRMATLHWSRFHGLIVSIDSPGGAVYLGQPDVLSWLRAHLSGDPS